MPRKKTGGILWEVDHYVARVTLDGKRERIHLPPGLSEAKAQEIAGHLAENPDVARAKLAEQKAQKASDAPIPKGETWAQYVKRWYEDRDRRGMAAINADRRFIEKHAGPHIGEKPIGDDGIQREDIEKLVQVWDDRTARGLWAWRTAQRAWHILCALFRDTCKSKNLELRVRKSNPTTDVAPPDTGEEKAKAFLWPNEFLQLMCCERVPLAARRLYALTIYLYSRASEVCRLRWTDIDLVHGTITISRAWDHERQREKSTKAGRVRMFAIEENLLPLLRVMYAERKDDGRVIPRGWHNLAKRFREHLQRAGITRADLFVSDDQHLQIRFHDGRASAITWAALRRDHVTTIMERVGHRDFATTQKYLRRADALRGRIGEPFPPLPACLLVSDDDDPGHGGNGHGERSDEFATLTFQAVSAQAFKVPTTLRT